MKTKIISLIIGLALTLSAWADWAIYNTTSIGLDETMCYARAYVGSGVNHSEEAAPGQSMARLYYAPEGWLWLNAIWLPTGNTITTYNGVFFETWGPYERYALLFFQSDGIHVHLNPKIYSSPWWVPCEDFYLWEQTPLGWRTYDP